MPADQNQTSADAVETSTGTPVHGGDVGKKVAEAHEQEDKEALPKYENPDDKQPPVEKGKIVEGEKVTEPTSERPSEADAHDVSHETGAADAKDVPSTAA